MKNIHVIPTEKPSRLSILNNGKLNFGAEFISSSNSKAQNIYITNDKKNKTGDWCMDIVTKYIYRATRSIPEIYNKSQQKIILTTDPDLIKDGVQAIDDEFLEWFVKNPSCEFVETLNVPYFDESGYSHLLIVPKEEPKQELSVRLLNSLKQFNMTLYNAINTEPNKLKQIGFSNRSIIELQGLRPKQETLEEARRRYISDINCELYSEQIIDTIKAFSSDAFEQGYKFAQEQDKLLRGK